MLSERDIAEMKTDAERRAKGGCADARRVLALLAERDQLRGLVAELAARAHAQSELLARKAGKGGA